MVFKKKILILTKNGKIFLLDLLRGHTRQAHKCQNISQNVLDAILDSFSLNEK